MLILLCDERGKVAFCSPSLIESQSTGRVHTLVPYYSVLTSSRIYNLTERSTGN